MTEAIVTPASPTMPMRLIAAAAAEQIAAAAAAATAAGRVSYCRGGRPVSAETEQAAGATG